MSEDPSQPRPPRNLPDLLRYSIEAAQTSSQPNMTNDLVPSSSGPVPMDEEKRKFLQETLKSLTINVTHIMAKAIQTLMEEDANNSCDAIQQLLEFVDNLDHARDFIKLGGLSALSTCLKSRNPELRALTATLLGELTQNNNWSQTQVLEAGFLEKLQYLLDTDLDQNVRVKALFAISCLIREYRPALDRFILNDGVSSLKHAVESRIVRLKIKAAFLIAALVRQHKDIIHRLVQDETLINELLRNINAKEDQDLLEHIIGALYELVSNNELAKKQLDKAISKNPDLLSALNIIRSSTESNEDLNQYTLKLLNMYPNS